MENATILEKHFQQTDFWADFKCAHGWSKVNFAENSVETTILLKNFKAGAFNATLAYVPMAPSFLSAEEREQFCARLHSFSKNVRKKLPSQTFCLRFDVPIDFETAAERDSFVEKVQKNAFRVKKSRVDVQPPDTVILDLSKSEEELLSDMKSKWRYNVRLAAKKGVKVRAVRAGDEHFERDVASFYDIYKTTAERDGIGLHPLSYYEDLLERGKKSEDSDVVLYIASHEGEDLAAIVVLFQKSESIYLYGCSSNEKRNLMPAYLVQWTAICDAKKFGSRIYDFYGIPPTNDEKHPMHGLYLFKTGFGGKEIHRPGSFDVPLSVIYFFYVLAENARAWYHKKFLKKIRGR